MSAARITYALILGALAFGYIFWASKKKHPDRNLTGAVLTVRLVVGLYVLFILVYFILVLQTSLYLSVIRAISSRPLSENIAPESTSVLGLISLQGFVNDSASIGGTLFKGFFGFLLYQIILWAALPFLRRVISAEGCACLWIFPALLSPLLVLIMLLKLQPLFYIPVRRVVVAVLTWIWIIGASISFTRRIVGHIRLRRHILSDAKPADDKSLQILGKVRMELGVKPKGELLYSSAVQAPLSIGVFLQSLKIVLPAQKTYSEQELRTILRHETVHLAHRDNLIKLFIAFITSAGWFLPLQRLGMARASEDLELNCDEAVVRGFSEAEKRLYADLLINNAGTAEGFTTCLSASAAGLRYRLKRLVQPGKRFSGALIGMLLMAAFTLSIGTVTFAYDGQPLSGILQDSLRGEDSLRIRLPLDRPKAEWEWSKKYYYRYVQDYSCEREEELTEYLSGITVYSCESHHSPDIVYTVSANVPQPEAWNQDWIIIGRIIFTPPEIGYSFIVAPSGTYVTTDAIDLDYLRSFAGDSLETTP